MKPNGLFSSLKREPFTFSTIKRSGEEPEELALSLEDFLIDNDDSYDNDDLVEYLEEEEEDGEEQDVEEEDEEDSMESEKEALEAAAGGEKKPEADHL